jgi:hypothetical protein
VEPEPFAAGVTAFVTATADSAATADPATVIDA